MTSIVFSVVKGWVSATLKIIVHYFSTLKFRTCSKCKSENRFVAVSVFSLVEKHKLRLKYSFIIQPLLLFYS